MTLQNVSAAAGTTGGMPGVANEQAGPPGLFALLMQATPVAEPQSLEGTPPLAMQPLARTVRTVDAQAEATPTEAVAAVLNPGPSTPSEGLLAHRFSTASPAPVPSDRAVLQTEAPLAEESDTPMALQAAQGLGGEVAKSAPGPVAAVATMASSMASSTTGRAPVSGRERPAAGTAPSLPPPSLPIGTSALATSAYAASELNFEWLEQDIAPAPGNDMMTEREQGANQSLLSSLSASLSSLRSGPPAPPPSAAGASIAPSDTAMMEFTERTEVTGDTPTELSSAEMPVKPHYLLSLTPQPGAWATAMQQRVQMMVNNGVQKAEIALDPADLGHVDVSVEVVEGELRVHMVPDNPALKDLIEAEMGKLREGLEEQGLSAHIGLGMQDENTARHDDDTDSADTPQDNDDSAAAQALAEGLTPLWGEAPGLVNTWA